MNCDCEATITAKLKENLIEQHPEATDHAARLQGYGSGIIENRVVVQGYMPYEMTMRVPVKKGGTRDKKIKGNMIFNFCPFCGKPAKEGA